MRALPALLLILLGLAGCLGDGAADDPAGPGPAPSTPPAGPIPPAWGDETAPIRPGASLGGYCTFNFLFQAPNGTAYIGTAGHCTDGPGQRVSLPGVGEIGTVVYDSDVFPDADRRVDFSLIRLDEEQIAQANPRMLNRDDPTGYVTLEDIAVGDVVELHGYGLVLGQNPVTHDRDGLLMGWDDTRYRINMPAVWGDSGSPILHASSGKALGIVSQFNFIDLPPTTDIGPFIFFILDELAKAGLGDIGLATV